MGSYAIFSVGSITLYSNNREKTIDNLKEVVMPMPLRCPFKEARPCIEENCAIWIEAGFIKTKEADNKMMRIHEPTGCCSVKAIAWKLQ